MSQSGRPTVVLVSRSFIIWNNLLLAVQRASADNHNPGLWEVPGGKLDEGQDLNAALEREVMEETGLLIRPIDTVAHFESYVIGGRGKYNGMPYVALFGVSTVIGGGLLLSHEHDASQLLTYEHFMQLHLTPETRKAGIVLRDRLKGHGVQ